MEIKRARTVRIPVNNQKQTDRVDKQRFRKILILDAKVPLAILSRKDEKSEK